MGPTFSGHTRFRWMHLTSQRRISSCVWTSSAASAGSSELKNRTSDSRLTMGTSRCLAMHDTISSDPMCRPRVRKLCTHATASCAGRALLNIDWRIRSVASSLDSDSLRNMIVLIHSALATCRASYPSCDGTRAVPGSIRI